MALSSLAASAATEKDRTHILKQINARWYFGGQAISLTGLMLRMATTSLFLVALLGKEKAAPYIGSVWALNLCVGSFLGAVIGVYLDRNDRRLILKLMAYAGIVQGLVLAYITRNGTHVPEELTKVVAWEIIAVSLLGSLPYAIDGVCRNSMVRDSLIDPRDHRQGSILFSSLYNFGIIIGNGLAGVSVGIIGYSGLFLVNAASYLVLIFALGKMDLSHVVKSTRRNGIFREVQDGMNYVFHNPGLRLSVLLSSAVIVFGYAYNVILTVINEKMFNGGPKDFSYLGSMSGFGCLAGSLAAIFYGAKHIRLFVVVSCLASGVAQIAMTHTTDKHVAAYLLFVAGAGMMGGFLPLRGALNHLIDDHSRASVVIGISFQFFFGGMMVSSFLAGEVAKHFGCPAVLMFCGAALIVTGIVTPFLPDIKKIC